MLKLNLLRCHRVKSKRNLRIVVEFLIESIEAGISFATIECGWAQHTWSHVTRYSGIRWLLIFAIYSDFCTTKLTMRVIDWWFKDSRYFFYSKWITNHSTRQNTCLSTPFDLECPTKNSLIKFSVCSVSENISPVFPRLWNRGLKKKRIASTITNRRARTAVKSRWGGSSSCASRPAHGNRPTSP